MECKKALKECDGNLDNAVKFLKEKGLIKAAEKSGRATSEGIICVAVSDDNSQGVALELSCETDFVARNEDFIKAAEDITRNVLSSPATSPDELPESIQNELKSLIARLGENMAIKQLARITNTNNDCLTTYIHQGGKIGVLLQMETGDKNTQSQEGFSSLAKDISMHIAAMNPAGLSKDDVDAKVLDEQKGIFLTQAKESGKPDNIIEKMVEGKMKQFLKEIVLLEQAFVKEPKTSIQQLLDAESKKLGDKVALKQFVRFKVGE